MPESSTGGLGAADAAARMGVRRHPVVLAAILSDLTVRAVEIAAAINSGRAGNPDRALIRVLAGDVARDLGRAREYAQARHLKLDSNLTRNDPLGVMPSRSWPDPALIRSFHAAVHLAHRLVHAIDGTLVRHLDLRLSLSRDEDLEPAGDLVAGLESDLDRALAWNEALEVARERIRAGYRPREQIVDINRSAGRALALALARSRTLDRVCAQGVAGRLGISQAQGLAQALLDGDMDDFTNADLSHAGLLGTDLSGVRWSLSGTIWPPETDVKALLARSEQVAPGGGVLVVSPRSRRAGGWGRSGG